MQIAVLLRLPGDALLARQLLVAVRALDLALERGGAGETERPLAAAVLAGVSAGMVRSHPAGGGAG